MRVLLAVSALAVSALAVAAAGPAAAQVAGNYAGTTSDGSLVQFTVAVDSNNVLAVTSDGVNFTAPCKGGGTLQSGWYWGSDDEFTNHKTSGSLEFAYATIKWTLQFSANGQTATGTVSSIAPTLTPVGPKPKKAQFCSSPKQAMTLTLQTNAARVAPPAGSVALLDSRGNAVAITPR